jgi:ubiquinone biosynthesis protein
VEKVGYEICETGKVLGYTKKPPLQREQVEGEFTTLLYSVATRDLELMTRSILKIGIKKGATIDTKKLHSDIEEIYNTYMDASFYDINIPQLMDEVFKTCRKNNIVMPAELTMLLKGLMTLEGVVAKIAPELDIMDIATPYVKKQMLKKRNLKQDFLENMGNLYTVSKVGLKLPIKLHELMNSVLAGKLKVQIEHTTLEKSMYQLSKMANRIVFGLIVSSLIIGSSLVINANVGPKIFDISILGLIGYIGAAITGLWLLISILRSGMM